MVPGFAAIPILFFRRHQHVARELARSYPAMDDEELHQKTKLVMGLTLLRITMHDYVARSLQSSHIKIKIKLGRPSSSRRCGKRSGRRTSRRVTQSRSSSTSCTAGTNSSGYQEDCTQAAVDRARRTAAVYDVEAHVCNELRFPEDEVEWLDKRCNSVARLVDEPDGLERVLFSAATQRAGKLALCNNNRWLLRHVATPSHRH